MFAEREAMTGRATDNMLRLPLDRLALCLDCETCFEVGTNSCPACGSRMWALVARFLDRRHRP